MYLVAPGPGVQREGGQWRRRGRLQDGGLEVLATDDHPVGRGAVHRQPPRHLHRLLPADHVPAPQGD